MPKHRGQDLRGCSRLQLSPETVVAANRSSGEPEVVLSDAIFKNVCVISPKGVFVSGEDGD